MSPVVTYRQLDLSCKTMQLQNSASTYLHYRALRLYDIGLIQTSVEVLYDSKGKMKMSVTYCLKIDTDVCKLFFL